MEFRQVVAVCRSAAAAAAAAATGTRPSLAAGTRPFASGVLGQRHHFSTDNPQQSGAATPAPQPPSEPAPARPLSMADKVAQLQASLSQSMPPSVAPRPPIRKNNILDEPHDAHRRAPTFPSSSSSSSSPGSGGAEGGAGDLLNLPTQISSDMEQATGTSGGGGGGGGADGEVVMSTWSEDEFLPKHYDVTEPELRLRPSTGRTIPIKNNVDVARGFRLLQRAVAQNKIRAHVRLTRFHERPALKRKRLLRERWRERFKNGFRATINRVMELKAQGW
ncbi:hypothetical protein VTH06DRAFT_105 [Thermothelomyces fergusii]